MHHLVRNPNNLSILAEGTMIRFEKEEDNPFAALKELMYLTAVVWVGLEFVFSCRIVILNR
jgi:hypothetical protein